MNDSMRTVGTQFDDAIANATAYPNIKDRDLVTTALATSARLKRRQRSLNRQLRRYRDNRARLLNSQFRGNLPPPTFQPYHRRIDQVNVFTWAPRYGN